MLMRVCNMPGIIDRKSIDKRVTHDRFTTKTNTELHHNIKAVL